MSPFTRGAIALAVLGTLGVIGVSTRFAVNGSDDTSRIANESEQIQADVLNELGVMAVVHSTLRREDGKSVVDIAMRLQNLPSDVDRADLSRRASIIVHRTVKSLGKLDLTLETKNPFAPPPRALQPIEPTPAVAPVSQTHPVEPAKPSPRHSAAVRDGSLSLVTFPEARVTEGASELGQTPLFNLQLSSGTHLLTLTGADGIPHRLSVPVRHGKNPGLKVNLDELPVR